MDSKKLSWLDKIFKNRVRNHILFWVGIIAGYSVIAGSLIKPWYDPFVNKIGYLPAQILFAYGFIYYLLPKLFFEKRYFRFGLSFIVLVYVSLIIARIGKIYIYEPFLSPDLLPDPIIDIITSLVPLFYQYLLWLFHIPLLMLLIKYTREHFREERRIQTLQKEKAKVELNFLKAQIHPHFLFNTLNNLYTLALDKSDQAPKVVRKLSGMLNYMLHNCNQPLVLVNEEINLIQDYIDLEMLRYGERLDLIFNHSVDEPSSKIAPLVLLSLVENAFKHGASGDPGQPKIHISLVVEKQQMHFRVYNTKSKIKQLDQTDYKKGIGASNIKRQLELIYPNQYLMRIDDQPDIYEVFLTINLDEIKPFTSPVQTNQKNTQDLHFKVQIPSHV